MPLFSASKFIWLLLFLLVTDDGNGGFPGLRRLPSKITTTDLKNT